MAEERRSDGDVSRSLATNRDECRRDYEHPRQREHQATEPDGQLSYERAARGSCEHIQAIERERCSARRSAATADRCDHCGHNRRNTQNEDHTCNYKWP